MIGIALALALGAAPAAAAPASSAAPAEECLAMVAEGDSVRLVPAPTFKLLNGPQTVALPDVGAEISGMECFRADIVPAAGDLRLLLQHSLPLFIVSPNQTVLVLSIVEGKVQAQVMRGALNDGERDRVLARLAEYERQASR